MGESKRRREKFGDDPGKTKETANQDYKLLAEAMESIKGEPPIPLSIDPISAFMLLAQIQLAVRHPNNQGPASELAKQVGRGLQERLVEMYPPIADYLEKGWYPIFDLDPTGEPTRMAKFSDLDIERQAYLYIKDRAFLIAVANLSALTNRAMDSVCGDFIKAATRLVIEIGEIELAKAIAEMDADHEKDDDEREI